MRTAAAKLVAVVLIAALPAAAAHAAEAAAALTGSIVSAADRGPIVGARVHVEDPRAGCAFVSQPTAADGAFALADLPPSTYRLAVEADGGLYRVETPVTLAAAGSRAVHLAVRPFGEGEPGDDDDDEVAEAMTGGSNPLVAALAVIGVATIVGLLISADDDDSPSSPSMP